MDTVRLGIVRKIQQMYEAVQVDGQPLFSRVKIGPLRAEDNRFRNPVGIVVSSEEKSDLFPLKQNQLDVNVEFRFNVNRGDEDPGVMVELALGAVQQPLYDDTTVGGLAVDTHEVGNEIDLFSYADKSVQGVVKFRVLYRHSAVSVYSAIPAT